MTANSVISVTLEVVGAGTGFYAAYCWWKASRVGIDPVWTVEPGEPDRSQAGWISGIMNNLQESARLNKRAALWTAASVLLFTISGILSAFMHLAI